MLVLLAVRGDGRGHAKDGKKSGQCKRHLGLSGYPLVASVAAAFLHIYGISPCRKARSRQQGAIRLPETAQTISIVPVVFNTMPNRRFKHGRVEQAEYWRDRPKGARHSGMFLPQSNLTENLCYNGVFSHEWCQI
jgi:hypothetical protein